MIDDLAVWEGSSPWKPNNHPDAWIPNAADVEHFKKSMHLDTMIPPELENIPKPIIGFIGSIDHWMDWEVVESVALAHPDWSIVVIGPNSHPNRDDFPKMKNVHLLGKKKYSELPAYIKGFDIGFLPFKKIPYIESSDPIILYDFLASGKCVVTTNFQAARNLQLAENSPVRIGKNPPEIIFQIFQILAELQSRPLKKHLQESALRLVGERNWKNRVGTQLEILEKFLSSEEQSPLPEEEKAAAL